MSKSRRERISGHERLAATVTICRAKRSAMALIQRRIDLAKQPATDEQLAQIWPPWNSLPADLLPEEKRWILTFDEDTKRHPRPERQAHLEALRPRFPCLPFDRDEYHQALNQAHTWATLLGLLQTTRTHHQALILKQWAFAEADSQASGRIAIYRAAEELKLTHAGLLDSRAPKLSDIQTLQSRYDAYKAARKQSLDALWCWWFTPLSLPSLS